MRGHLDLEVHPMMHTNKIVISSGYPDVAGGEQVLLTLRRDPDANPWFLLYVHGRDEPHATVKYDPLSFVWTLHPAAGRGSGIHGAGEDLFTVATDWVMTRYGLPGQAVPAPAALEEEDHSGEPLFSERWDPADGELQETDPQARAEQLEEDRQTRQFGE